MTPVEIAEELGRSGLCICPDFLDPHTVADLRSDVSRRYDEGVFARAAVGNGAKRAVEDSVRRDEIFWLEPLEPMNPAQKYLFIRLDALKIEINRRLFLGLRELEIHYAQYPPGGFYQRHRDSFANYDARQVSLVVYLNEMWRPEHGGQLRCYTEQGPCDIDPVGGTLVCFLSRDIEHEVLPSQVHRKSLAGWFRS